MKKLIILLFFIPLFISAQSVYPVYIEVKDTVETNYSWYIIYDTINAESNIIGYSKPVYDTFTILRFYYFEEYDPYSLIREDSDTLLPRKEFRKVYIQGFDNLRFKKELR